MMMQGFSNNEKGEIFVEATIVLPICIVAILAFFYAALFMAQKANLQANLQNALIYYKSQESDTFVRVKDHMSYTTEEGKFSAIDGKIHPEHQKTAR